MRPQFAEAVRADGAADGPATKSFLQKVRSGAITVAGSVGSATAVNLLTQAASSFFG